jgi:phosphoribosylaminoimidazole (AIR) synthetase
MPSMYPVGEYDLAGFAVGAVRQVRAYIEPTQLMQLYNILLVTS